MSSARSHATTQSAARPRAGPLPAPNRPPDFAWRGLVGCDRSTTATPGRTFHIGARRHRLIRARQRLVGRLHTTWTREAQWRNGPPLSSGMPRAQGLTDRHRSAGCQTVPILPIVPVLRPPAVWSPAFRRLGTAKPAEAGTLAPRPVYAGNAGKYGMASSRQPGAGMIPSHP